MSSTHVLTPRQAEFDAGDLGFPEYSVYPLAIAKLVGLAVILSRRSRLLTGLAFAGFFYDLVLALSAHIAQADPVRGSQAAVAPAVMVLGKLGLTSRIQVVVWAYENGLAGTTRRGS